MSKDFIFDPKILILPPYFECPNCGEINSFGVLSIHDGYYIRRCKECWYDESYGLPKLDKKIIYLDQFVISNMMKSLNSKIQTNDANDDFFRNLFLKLEFLAKVHIVVCPDSLIHYDESIMSKHYEDIRAMYRYLSFGTSYMPTSTISRFHFVSAFRKYITGEDDIEIDRDTVCSGYNKWKDRIRVDIDTKSEKEDRKQIEESKLKLLQNLQPVFDKWKFQKPFVFDDVYKRELYSPSKLYIKRYLDFTKEIIKANMGIEGNINEYISDEKLVLVKQMLDILEENGVNNLADEFNTIQSFFQSDIMLEIPNHRIECLMWAAFARKAAYGQKSIKKISIVNDIRAISSYMPYSDAIFIDKECHGLLNDDDVSKRLKCNTKIFSLYNKNDFLMYLDDMISEVPEEHIELIKRVYGEQWMKPYTSMYD